MAAFEEKRIARRTHSKKSAAANDAPLARAFVRKAYEKHGGATKKLKEIFSAYVEHERKRAEKAKL
jgi:hypothetical protein